MKNRWRVERGNAATYVATQALDAQRRKDILGDARHSDAARAREVQPIEASLRTTYGAFTRTSAGHEAAELADWYEARPDKQLVNAAAANPTLVRTWLDILRETPGRRRVMLVEKAAADGDFALLFAAALPAATANADDKQRQEIEKSIALATRPVARQADADLIGFRQEALRLKRLGWQADENEGTYRGSLEALQDVNEALTLPPEYEGATARSLSGAELTELLALAGVPKTDAL